MASTMTQVKIKEDLANLLKEALLQIERKQKKTSLVSSVSPSTNQQEENESSIKFSQIHTPKTEPYLRLSEVFQEAQDPYSYLSEDF